MGFYLKKYSEQVKLAAVQAYRDGTLGWKATAKAHDVETSSLRKWVAAYEVHGPDGVREKRRELYSREFKLKVLRRMRDEDLSYRQAAALFDIRNFNIIGTWERAYERDGMPGLAAQWAGRRKKMTTPENQKSNSSLREGDKRTREQLLEELQSLRLENAYLKKLDALVQSQAKSAPGRKRKS